MKHLISDLPSLQEYLKTVDSPVFGIGARAYNLTIGVHSLFKNFTILACNGSSKEVELLKDRLPIIYLEKNPTSRNKENYKTYQTKKPLDLLRDERITHYLDSFEKKPVLLFFKMSQEAEDILSKKNYTVVGSSFAMFEKYENKITFQNLLDTLGIKSPKHATMKARQLNYVEIKKSIGKKFVIQLPSSELGAGTFFVFNENDFNQTLCQSSLQEAQEKNIDLKIAEYVEASCSPSITVCITRFGILSTSLQRQLLDIEEVLEPGRRSGVYCGHDWSASNFSPEIEKQAKEIVEKIGIHFKEKEGFSGIFGIDFILKNERLYPIEANMRLLGSFPVLSMVQESANQPLIQGLQILDRLERDNYELNVESLNACMQQYKRGAHINLYSKSKNPSYVSGDIRPGIYKVDTKTKRISYIRKGIFYNDLYENDEILITSGVPYAGRVYQRHNTICKLISRRSLVDSSDGKLNEFAKTMIQYTYDKLALKDFS